MTSQHDNAKRWRPRFSIRTLAIVVTLICVYLACWEITKRDGIPAVTNRVRIISEQDVYDGDGITNCD